MGLFDKIFAKSKKKQDKDIEESQKRYEQEKLKVYGHDLQIEDSDEVVSVLSINKVNRVAHRNGKVCDVYTAKAILHKEDYEFMPDLGDDVCFEVKENTIIDHELLDYVAGYYLLNKSKDKSRVYLGEIEKNKDTLDLNNKYVLGDKSQTVNQWFDGYIDKQNEEKRKKMEEKMNRTKQEEFRAKLKFIEENKIEAEKRNAEREALIQERISNPYLKQTVKGITPSQIRIEEYDGINISNGNNRGDILRIIGLQKIGKDGSGTYLYSGHLQNTRNESDAIMFDYGKLDSYGLMTPVCFELYRRLEDIVAEQNPEEIREVLKFLSEPQNFRNNEQLNYIGHLSQEAKINQFGEIERKIVAIRGENSTSPAIAKQISSLQKSFAETHSRDSEEGR